MQLPGNRLRKQAGACFYVILFIFFFNFLFCKGSARGRQGEKGRSGVCFYTHCWTR